jgi:hypothetical protein
MTHCPQIRSRRQLITRAIRVCLLGCLITLREAEDRCRVHVRPAVAAALVHGWYMRGQGTTWRPRTAVLVARWFAEWCGLIEVRVIEVAGAALKVGSLLDMLGGACGL